MTKKLKYFVGDKIKRYRRSCSLTQAQLARQVGMTRTTIVAIEQGVRGISDEEATQIESALLFDQGALLAPPPEQKSSVGIHVYYGHHVSIREKNEQCWHCGTKKQMLMYHTYFGAPLCASCWDNWWRTTEDGETDPPATEIKNPRSGEWL